MAEPLPSNLYVHFPFCRRKCTYCVLPSRAGRPAEERDAYVARIAKTLSDRTAKTSRTSTPHRWRTIYFGGGSPGLCDLTPLGKVLEPSLSAETEFTVELHPLDVTRSKLEDLKAIGVNRISMGVQSLDDAVLLDMGRGYTADEAERAFALIKEQFDNAGIDLIVGYPTQGVRRSATNQPSPTQGVRRSATDRPSPQWHRLASWGLSHCSVYSLILEEGSILSHRLKRTTPSDPQRGQTPSERGLSPLEEGLSPFLPSDDEVLDELQAVAEFLQRIGLERYEISNYAVPGCECRHNLATWRGEDYLGLGDGACGRIGLTRTRNEGGQNPEVETVSPVQDELERRIFRLRTREGLDPAGHPEWLPILERFTAEGLLIKTKAAYRLTARGTEVCDSILAELI